MAGAHPFYRFRPARSVHLSCCDSARDLRWFPWVGCRGASVGRVGLTGGSIPGAISVLAMPMLVAGLCQRLQSIIDLLWVRRLGHLPQSTETGGGPHA